MDDIVFQFNKLEPNVDSSGITFAPNIPAKVKNFRFTDSNIYLCSLTFEVHTYLKDMTGSFTERVFIFIPNDAISHLEQSSMAFSSYNQGALMESSLLSNPEAA